MRRLLAVTLSLAACGSPPPASKPAPSPPPAGAVAPPPPPTLTGPVTLEQLHAGQAVHAWTALAVYVDDNGARVGGRFQHVASGFTLDYLRIESAPQGFLYVTSFPTSDKGEPHTQEHLLLGKGDRGRRLGSYESMALAESSAFTAQWRTAYHFRTLAGHDTFWPEMDNELGALIYPDYTDEEIRREVRNFGVDKDNAGTLRLEEKGTVYNEMVRYYEDPDAVLGRSAGQMLYGEHHPLAYESGGYPEAIRAMTPTDIRVFHDAAYRFSNMGMIGAFPSDMALGDVLDQTSAVLGKEMTHGAAPKTPPAKITTEAQLPAPAPAPAGQIRIVDYPYSDTTSPGPMMLAWPATRDLDPVEHQLLELFVAQLASDESTPLYRALIAGKTRALDLGARRVAGDVSWEQGQPVTITLDGVKADKLDDASVAAVRTLVLAELARIAALPDGDPELAAIAARIDGRIVETRRKLIKLLDTPPGFGTRTVGTQWIDFLHQLQRTAGFQKSLTLRQVLAQVDTTVHARGNPWRTRLRAWGLLATPYGIAARPSTELRARIDSERAQRVTAELARLEAYYKTSGAPATLAAYARDYDAQTAAIDGAASATELPPLVAHPPMTLDDDLSYRRDPVAGLPALRAAFPTMSSARVTLAFRLDAVPEADLMYLALLPQLLGDAGMLDGDKPISAADVRERERTEILGLDLRFQASDLTSRVELTIAGSGINAGESKAALQWMGRAMFAPDWRVENLPRLRDLVQQEITANRARMLGAEERWVADPRNAWARQGEPLRLHATSFLTRAHDLHRLRWRLEDPGDAKLTAEVAAALDKLAGASTLPRAQLVELAARLGGDPKLAGAPATGKLAAYLAKASAGAEPILRDAGKDLAALLPDLPDGSLAADWRYLCREMAADLRAGAPAALAGLARTRAAVIAAANARLVEVGAQPHLDAIAGDVEALIRKLDPAPPKRQTYPAVRPIAARLRDHERGPASAPMYVGLVDPATSSGVFENLAPMPGYTATTDAAVIDTLTAALYSGHGAHSMFSKTWAAGLAYSNGMRPDTSKAWLEYYAERCPLLPQTLRFVIAQLRDAKPDANIARYAVAKSFVSRVGDGFEARAAAMAADFADGVSTVQERELRTKIVALAGKQDLADTLFARLPAVYGRVLPGFGAPAADATYFVIGPDKQLAAFQDYLHGAVGKTATLHRLYPRDYWIPAKL